MSCLSLSFLSLLSGFVGSIPVISSLYHFLSLSNFTLCLDAQHSLYSFLCGLCVSYFFSFILIKNLLSVLQILSKLHNCVLNTQPLSFSPFSPTLICLFSLLTLWLFSIAFCAITEESVCSWSSLWFYPDCSGFPFFSLSTTVPCVHWKCLIFLSFF